MGKKIHYVDIIELYSAQFLSLINTFQHHRCSPRYASGGDAKNEP